MSTYEYIAKNLSSSRSKIKIAGKNSFAIDIDPNGTNLKIVYHTKQMCRLLVNLI